MTVTSLFSAVAIGLIAAAIYWATLKNRRTSAWPTFVACLLGALIATVVGATFGLASGQGLGFGIIAQSVGAAIGGALVNRFGTDRPRTPAMNTESRVAPSNPRHSYRRQTEQPLGLDGRRAVRSTRPPRTEAYDTDSLDDATAGVFISYRRQDEPNFAGRLYDKLSAQFGETRVFIDVDSVELGVDFLEVISQTLLHCRILLVVIGRGWLNAVDQLGNRRLDNPDDYVRLEIESALHKRDVRVIPVLVEGAAIPNRSQLPASLAPLARRNAIEMSHSRFAADADRLIRTIEPLF